MTCTRWIVAAAIAVLTAPGAAQADWLLTPYIGGNAGGDTVGTQTNFGVSAGWMGAGVFGFEFDAGAVPDFFESGNEDATALVNDSSAGTYMFNVIAGAPVGGQTGPGVRPYASVGLGAIRTRVESDLGLTDSQNTDFGWNVGGGVMGFFTDAVGLRGDVRYFGSLQNELDGNDFADNVDRFGFWRLTGGVVFRFGGM